MTQQEINAEVRRCAVALFDRIDAKLPLRGGADILANQTTVLRAALALVADAPSPAPCPEEPPDRPCKCGAITFYNWPTSHYRATGPNGAWWIHSLKECGPDIHGTGTGEGP
jgi:hypothetical protein